MAEILDNKDKNILDALKENSRLSTQQIAKKIFIPITTVHNRIKKLEKEGIIKKYTVILDNKKIGKQITAYVLIVVDYISLKEANLTQHQLAKKIKENPNVEEIAIVTGGTDILLKVRVSDIDELDSFITKYLRNTGGVEKTQTLVVLHES